MRLLENKHGDWLVLAADDTMLGYYGTRQQAQGHIDKCAAAAALRDAGGRPDFSADKMHQTKLLSLDGLPNQTLMFEVDGCH